MDCNAFAGTLSGIFKTISINSKMNTFHNFQCSNLSDGSPPSKNEITALSWADETQNEILIAHKSQFVQTFSRSENRCTSNVSATDGNTGPIVGLCRINESLVTAFSSGTLKIWKFKNETSFDVIAHQRSQFGSRRHKNRSQKSLNSEKEERFLSVMRSSSHYVALGGKESDLQLWDLNSMKSVFSAKNLPHDSLQLRVPIWISDISFLTQSLVCSVSQYGAICLYDTRSSRRRPTERLLSEVGLRCSSSTSDDHRLLVGSLTGVISLYDFRMMRKGLVRKYRGSVGCVRSLSMGNSGIFGSVGLDRFLRIYNIESKKSISTLYLKSKLTSVLLDRNFDPFSSNKMKDSFESHNNDSDVQIVDDEESWDGLLE